jgi:hypothetical protein
MNAWDNLPNAKHIDFVLESVKKYSDEWRAARATARAAVCDAELEAAYYAVMNAPIYAPISAAWRAAWGAVKDVAHGTVYKAATGAILALIAYDDCDQYLDMSYNELLFMARLTQIPATILLLPYAKAMELIELQLNSSIV